MSRRTVARFAIWGVIVVIGLVGLVAWWSGSPRPLGLPGGGLAGNPDDAIIVSVLHRDNLYIASTRFGLYQASDADKVWRKMPTPSTMPGGGYLAEEGPGSSRIIYYTGQPDDWPPMPETRGSLYISDDGGKSWAASWLNANQNVLDAFAQPGGSIFAITHDSSDHLLLSRTHGYTWKDITPPLQPGFGLFGISPDPDHPGLVCVRSGMIGHISRTSIYQAEDETYHWSEYPLEDWHNGRDLWGDFGPPAGGTNNSNMPATLKNFFKFPYPRSGRFPDLPTKYLTTDKPAYIFHLHQPMPVMVTTVFMFPESGIKWLDNKNEKVFWELRIQPDGERGILDDPQTAELNFDIPNRNAKIAAYLNDPDLVTVQVDQAHPYRRAVDLDKLYDFTNPGHYRLHLSHADLYLDHSGSLVSTSGIDVSLLP
jgi:hypothetical protein